MASEKIDGFTLEQRHGKARVRLGRVWRSQSGRHIFVEWTVSISLLSNCLAAYVRDDNSDIVATDSMKNTVYAKAKECAQQLSMESVASEKIDGFTLEQRHGKARVRLGRVWRSQSGRHIFVEWTVSISLLSNCLAAYVRDDNSDIVATDSMKNTVYAKAKECAQQLSMEEFAIKLAKHFTSFYQQVTTAIVTVEEKPWERAYIDGQPHDHGFKRGSETHTTEVIVEKSGALQVTSGIQGLALLKTTQAGFEGFIRDKYTALADTRERIVATEVTASWRYPFESLSGIPLQPLYFTEKYLDVKKVLAETFFGPPRGGVYSPSVQSTLYQMAKNVLNRFPDISSIQLKMPNLHFLPVNISSKDNPAIVKFDDDVYLPTSEPHGSIEATVSRIRAKI